MKHKAKKRAAAETKLPRTMKPRTKRSGARSQERDPRLPASGTTIRRPYKGRDIEVTVLDHGFRWDGKEFRSISALAAAITGATAINGYFWFHLTDSAQPVEPSKGKRSAAATAAALGGSAETAPAT